MIIKTKYWVYEYDYKQYHREYMREKRKQQQCLLINEKRWLIKK